ncbi:S41 family peptidase [Amycolatopsis sp. NBC_00345]|uniref:S41 family peptidase n=1 Tax=Amycolatopsis sp. NBC_00345 TaxID=2975955 RepID=UPI002E2768C5
MAVMGAVGLVALALGGSVTPVSTVDTVDGVWRSDGYGQVVRVAGGALTTYDVTAVSCLPGSLTGTGDGTTFATSEGTVATVRPRGRDHASLSFDGDLGVRSLTRLPGLPAACTTAPPTGALSTFDVFWHSYAENYPFFAAKGVDWRAEGAAAREQVAAHPERLYEILCGLITPLHDAHVALIAGGDHCSSPRPGTPDYPGDPALRKRIKDVTDANVGVPLQTWAGGAIAYADLPGGTGYLRVTRFEGYTDTFAGDKAELDRALDAIFTAARVHSLHGLVLDLRVNGGGADPLGLEIASRLTDTPHFAYAKRARNDPDDPARFTVPQPLFVRPAAGPRYTGPLAVLVGDLDVSAGETFTQALLNRTPRPVLVGQNTQGVYSDTMGRTLPAPGWMAVVPNEEYLDPRGHTYDGTGIAPDVRTPVFTPEELAAGRDTGLATARSLVTG